jgi:hypothetical protein
METLIFTEHPEVTIATNKFIRIPIVLQYEDTPLIQIVKHQNAGYTTAIPIYHSDGTYLAKAVGSQLYPTPQGKQAGVALEHPDRMTVCKLGNRVLFEITRTEAAGLKTTAELHTPDGYFVRCADTPAELFDATGNVLRAGGAAIAMTGCTFMDCRIGILLRRNGSVAIPGI